MKMLNSRRGVIFIPIIVVIGIILLIIVLAKIGQICLFGKCFYLISPQFSKELNFWILITFWIVLQVAFIYLYAQIGILARRGFKFIREKWGRFIEYFRRIMTS